MKRRQARPAVVSVAKSTDDGGYAGEGGKIQTANRRALTATVIGGTAEEIEKAASASKQDVDDPFSALIESGKLIEPPFNLMVLTMMEENSAWLRPIVDAMETNVEGFGGRLQIRSGMSKDDREKYKKEIEAERKKLRSLVLNLNPEDSLTSLRRKMRRSIELTGNAYWELIPRTDNRDVIAAIDHVAPHTIRISKQDEKPIEMKRKVVDPETGEVVEQTFFKRFRRFCQIRGAKKIWFKEYGDPRLVDRRDGTAYSTEASASAAGVTKDDYAHALYHFRIHTDRSPYGLPRYVGNLFSAFGSRAADEINYNTFLNNNVPSMAVLVSGNAMLTEGTINRINEFSQAVMKRSANYSKFLLLEAESNTEGLQNTGTAQIKIERLKNEQHDDQLFQKYDANNAEKLRQAWRIPPIYVGRATDFNRATAETSKKLAEEQVFGPERNEVDRHINQILQDQNYQYWEYKSFSANITNDEDLVKLLSQVEKTGALTPNFARRLIADIMNTEPDLYEKNDKFDPDVPFSLTMAEAVKGEGSLGGNPATGALAPNRGQIPKSVQKALIDGDDIDFLALADAARRAPEDPEPKIRLVKKILSRVLKEHVIVCD